MKIIDAHMHVNLNGFSIQDLIAYLDQKNIEKCWLLSWEELNPSIEYIFQHLGLDRIMEAFQQYPERIIPFYAPDPSDKEFERKLKSAVDQGVKGCGELKVTSKWEDRNIEDYLKVVNELRLPLVFHMEQPRYHYVPSREDFTDRVLERLMNDKYNGVSRYYLSRIFNTTGIFRYRMKSGLKFFPGYLYDFHYLEKRIARFPDLKFIGHGPDFWNAISSNYNPKFIHQKGRIKEFGIIDGLLEEYSNFYCDISGTSGFNAITRDKDAGRRFLEKHSDKILFGTDNTKYDLIEYLVSLNLSASKLESILHLNSRKIMED